MSLIDGHARAASGLQDALDLAARSLRERIAATLVS
jgi:hypothetical protein